MGTLFRRVTVSIVRKGNGSETSDSGEQSVSVSARPKRPTPTAVDVSTAGGTGQLTGLTAGVTYEVSTDGGKTWVSRTADGSGQITGLAPGTYVVRVKAGADSFASENSDPAVIGAYRVRVTFMANGDVYREISIDYGTDLTDIPAVPPKKDAGDQTYTGAWCMDEQGTTPAVFTNIAADMTVYAVYTAAYTVTLQGGTGYTLTAQSGSESPVKEGGSFTFRFALASGYQKNASFAVKVNGVKVELAADGTHTISGVRENKTVTVEGVAKKPGGKPSNPGGKDKEDDPKPEPEPEAPASQLEAPEPDKPTLKPSVTPPAKATPPAPGTKPPAAEKEPEDRKPKTTQKQEENGAQKESGATEKEQEPKDTDTQDAGTQSTDEQTQAADSADAGQTEEELQEGKWEIQTEGGAGADNGAKCRLCHICPTFLGICYFIWLAVIIAVIVIVILLVLHRKKEEEPEGRR